MFWYDSKHINNNQQDLDASQYQGLAEFKLKNTQKLTKEWGLEQLRDIIPKRYVHRKTALEISFVDNTTIFLNFPDGGNDAFTDRLIELRKKYTLNLTWKKKLEPKKYFEKQKYLQKWTDNEISNFEYLMVINNLSSRSYNDISQYHVFPWVISNYSIENNEQDQSSNSNKKKTPILEQNKNYRQLSKPIGAQGSEQKLKEFTQRYNDNKQQDFPPPFMYGSHYSSPALVLQFLIRLDPFTTGSKMLQNGNFDVADRLFISLQDSWRCCMNEISDVRELIPEFYYLPEMFLNIQNLDLGIQQNGERVNHVNLPYYANNNPYKFVVEMRKALEGKIASQSLNQWIDLIFGSKSRGVNAEQARNVFYYMTYEDKVQYDKMDKDEIFASEMQVQNFGQVPQQLFEKDHIPKFPSNNVSNSQILLQIQQQFSPNSANNQNNIVNNYVLIKVYRPSQKQKTKKQIQQKKLYQSRQEYPTNALQLPSYSILHSQWISDTRFTCLQKSGNIMQYQWKNNPVETENNQQKKVMIPFQCGIESEYPMNLTDDNNNFNAFNFDQSLNSLQFPSQFINYGKHIVIGGIWDGSMHILSRENQQIIHTYNVHTSTVTKIKTDIAKQNFLFTGCKKGEVIIWKLNLEFQFIVQNHYYDHSQQITDININVDLKLMATSSLDGSINIYNYVNGEYLRTLYHPENLPIHNVVLSSSPIGSIMFFSENDKCIYTYSINGQQLEKKSEKNSDYKQMTSPIIVKDSSHFDILVYGNEKGSIFIRELPFLKLRREMVVSPKVAVIQISTCPQKQFLHCACSDGEISVLSWAPMQNNNNNNKSQIQQNSKK